MDIISEICSIASPGQPINEDSWLLFELSRDNSNLIFAAAIDGASTRYAITTLDSYLREKRRVTQAAFAATTVRNNLVSQLINSSEVDLKLALLNANTALREEIAKIIGGFSPDLIASFYPEVIASDNRRIRLLLPSCVATLIRINVREQVLDFAHVGDTSLIEVKRNGSVLDLTPDQMRKFDQQVLRLALDLLREENLPHFKDAVKQPAVIKKDKDNGLRHNYVNSDGYVILEEGCGAINGLPELADYIVTERVRFDPALTAGFCLMTDGLKLPAPLGETLLQEEERLEKMGALLIGGGLKSLFSEMDVMLKTDPYHDKYHRIKGRDDATGLWIKLA